MTIPSANDALLRPAAEVAIDVPLIAALLEQQFPHLADRSISIVGEGWDNVMAKLEPKASSPALAVRLPRREVAVALLLNEQQWLPTLAPQLPLPIPAPIACGVPNAQFPWPWSIVPWLEGTTADRSPLKADQVPRYCAFFKALHHPAPPDAPNNPVRSCTLAEKSSGVVDRFDALRQQLPTAKERLIRGGLGDVDAALQRWRDIWDAGVIAPPPRQTTWIAGDVHPRNVISNAGILTGFIDFGDLTFGDRCTDLASIWGLFPDATARAHAIETLALSDTERTRLAAWGVFYGVTLVQTGLGVDDDQVTIGLHLLARLVEDLDHSRL